MVTENSIKWLKKITRVACVVILLYGMLLAGMVYFFDGAENHKNVIERQLSNIYQRSVSIDRINTAWQGIHPRFEIVGVKVVGDAESEPDLTIKSVSAKINGYSLLTLWPQFTELAVSEPRVRIVTLENGKLQVAGITIGSSGQATGSPKRLLSWLLNHHNADVYSGSVVWHRLSGEIQKYQDISFVYRRLNRQRTFTLVANTPKGDLAFRTDTNGDLLAARDWDASFEILGNQGQPLVAKNNIALRVEDGQGQLTLSVLDVQRIRDILRLSGLGNDSMSWLLESRLSGRLHDVVFMFSGPLANLTNWRLEASASAIGFDAVASLPGMNNLQGAIEASQKGGRFQFQTQDTRFIWPKWFNKNMDINLAQGEFHWSMLDSGRIDIALKNAEFQDSAIHIQNLNARCEVVLQSARISNVAALFKVDSVSKLTYVDGQVIDSSKLDKYMAAPVLLDAEAQFSITSMAKLERYFPNTTHKVFRRWWKEAFVQGAVKQGQISYRGELSKTAFDTDKGVLSGQAKFSDLVLDYGYQRAWPRLLNGKGVVSIKNDVLSIIPEQAWLGVNQIKTAKVALTSLFSSDRQLQIDGNIAATLNETTKFLFQGPLISSDELKQNPPLVGVAGLVDSDLHITMPLSDVTKTKVQGTATIRRGALKLPEGVLLSNINGKVRYTEQSAETDDLDVDFLDGTARIRLQTIQRAQPPKLKVIGQGKANVKALEPWAGSHLLSLLDGAAEWQGEVLIDDALVNIDVRSDLQGVSILTPDPLAKDATSSQDFHFTMQTGSDQVQTRLAFQYADNLAGQFVGDLQFNNTVYDQAVIKYGKNPADATLTPGINFDIEAADINLDDWLDTIIGLAELPTSGNPDSTFLDAMRSLSLTASQPFLFGRTFSPLALSALSVDGASWVGTIKGEQVNGTLQAEPRTEPAVYRLNLANLIWPNAPDETAPVLPIDASAEPASFPSLFIKANSFRLLDRELGRLELRGMPDGQVWRLDNFSLTKKHLKTSATGQWQNTAETGSMSQFKVNSDFREVGDVMGDLDFAGVIKKGKGRLQSDINWIGGPHEFDMSRLNGNFELTLQDGELLKIEPGSGKLFGLFNVNAITRRLRFDFSDLFSSGLEFDRMHYQGILADGDLIFRDAYIFSPAAYIKAEGKVGLANEDVDLEFHVSPELGGNLTLLSALANPTAGAVLFITQKLFKSELRSASFKSYRALGNWDQVSIEPLQAENNLTEANDELESPQNK